jgi:hypothetical protein
MNKYNGRAVKMNQTTVEQPVAEGCPRADMRFFFWLPKTAGGTLRLGIKDNPWARWPAYPSIPSPDTLPAPSSAQLWVGGHMTFGLHLVYNAEPVYMTVLRDPIERLISEFFYHHQHDIPDIFIPDNELIPAFIRVVEAAEHLNVYSYMFSDYCFAKESIETGQGAWNGNPEVAFDLALRRSERLGFLTENIVFQNVNVEETFRKASNNIRSMRFIGFFDRFDNTLAYLRDEFGLDISRETRIHETRWKPPVEDLPGHIRDMLARKTEADREFFQNARQMAAA